MSVPARMSSGSVASQMRSMRITSAARAGSGRSLRVVARPLHRPFAGPMGNGDLDGHVGRTRGGRQTWGERTLIDDLGLEGFGIGASLAWHRRSSTRGLKWCPPKTGGRHATSWRNRGGVGQTLTTQRQFLYSKAEETHHLYRVEPNASSIRTGSPEVCSVFDRRHP